MAMDEGTPGVIELTNICRVNCDYCPMRRDNTRQNTSYVLEPADMLSAGTPLEEQHNGKGNAAGDDLVLGGGRYKSADRKQTACLQKQPEIADGERLPIGVAETEQKREMKRRKSQHAGV